jgi:two-component system, LuxR family, sensor kinase FixL
MNVFLLYSPQNRTALIAAGLILIFVIAVVDAVTPTLPMGYLYLIPIVMISGFVGRGWIAMIVVVCAIATSVLSRYEGRPAITLFVMALTGFAGTGFFISEMVSNRQRAIEYAREMETQVRLRRETEDQLRGLVESSPLAILTIGADGNILLANDGAHSLLAPGDEALAGQPIGNFLPALQSVIDQAHSKVFRTKIRCRGKRKNGEGFLAAVWFSTAETEIGPIVSAIIVDFSEDIRDRDDLSLEHLLKNAKILIGALSHEIRNLCGAILVVYRNLSRLPGLGDNPDFRALGGLIEGLEKLSAMELKPTWHQSLAAMELSSILDEFRVVIEHSYSEEGMTIAWQMPERLPLVLGDRYGLQQVFLNLARNSQRAMEMTPEKLLTVTASVGAKSIVIRFEDTGIGVADPGALFRPFTETGSTGLGLYVSRAILRSFRGDLQFEPRERGCCFAVTLARFTSAGEP